MPYVLHRGILFAKSLLRDLSSTSGLYCICVEWSVFSDPVTILYTEAECRWYRSMPQYILHLYHGCNELANWLAQ